MPKTKNVKPGEFIILQERASTMHELLGLVQRLAAQSKQINIYKEGSEWVVSYNEGPSNG